MRESEIERYLVAAVERAGGEVRKVKWIGRRGAPDRLVMHLRAGRLWVELKAPGEVPETHQLREHDRMRRMGQRVLVIDNKHQVDELLKGLNMSSGDSYKQVELNVIRWAEARGIIPNAKPYTQLLKGVSELGELADAEIKNDLPEIKDAVGDVLVCLIVYCALRDIDIVDCLAGAYDEIKDRKGKLLPNGTFVKEA